MIISVEELKQRITTDKSDQELEEMLQALELSIRAYTHNNFLRRGIRSYGTFEGGFLYCDTSKLKDGDTVQISQSVLNEGLLVVQGMNEDGFPVEGSLDEFEVFVTKVEYPADVKQGVVNLVKWELKNRPKVGIQSESLSRKSVTYFNMDGDNSLMGYPKSLLGFLRPYKRPRF